MTPIAMLPEEYVGTSSPKFQTHHLLYKKANSINQQVSVSTTPFRASCSSYTVHSPRSAPFLSSISYRPVPALRVFHPSRSPCPAPWCTCEVVAHASNHDHRLRSPVDFWAANLGICSTTCTKAFLYYWNWEHVSRDRRSAFPSRSTDLASRDQCVG